MCGDRIKIELIANNNKIRSIRYETESCILCEASASLMARKIKNHTLQILKKDIKILKDSIKNKKSIFPKKFKEYRYLVTKNNINRTNCVTLPLDALLKAFKL